MIQWNIDELIIGKGKPKFLEKIVSQCHFFPSQMPHGMLWG
jgi:hypothetical protein